MAEETEPVASPLVTESLTATVFGGEGDDTILLTRSMADIHFKAGDGTDTIIGGRQHHTLTFDEGLSAGDAVYKFEGEDLTIGFKGADDKVILKGWKSETSPSIQFSDGTTLSGADIQNAVAP